MNWGKITKYAAVLFVAQVAVGFVTASVSSSDVTSGVALLAISSTISFLVCGAIFAHLAARQPIKPFAHAWAALALQAVAAIVLWQLLAQLAGSPPSLLIILEWLVLIGALLVGTSIGMPRKNRSGPSADA